MIKSGNITVKALLLGVIFFMVTTSSSTEDCPECEQTSETITEEQETKFPLEMNSKEDLLEKVVILTTQCTNSYVPVPVKVPTQLFKDFQDTVLLIKRILERYFSNSYPDLFPNFIHEVVLSEEVAVSGRILWIGNGSLNQPDYFTEVNNKGTDDLDSNYTISTEYNLNNVTPWLNQGAMFLDFENLLQNFDRHFKDSWWTLPYYSCDDHKWLISFTSPIIPKTDAVHDKNRVVGLISADIDITAMDINQCDNVSVGVNISEWQIDEFLGTHKCEKRTTKCSFVPGLGWTHGAYQCECRKGYYSSTGSTIFNGSWVEMAYREKRDEDNRTYDTIYVCQKCEPGCYECIDNSPCLSTYNWTFRGSLLSICIACIILTLILSAFVYRYRKLKVFKVASPIFLFITLVGCIIMYCEMAAIFPVLDMCTCIATKWTRHMGFCITYSALLLKTWRVSLTYRVKSAHKLKLTDRQLLQWLFPILLVMAIYLGTWTISSPPPAVYIKDWNQLKFKQCDYNWWDHSLGIGEFLFLLWGIKVCYNVRNAESVFNEARHISWAVHNITIVNIFMVFIHLIILPSAGPDEKYLFGFIRTQLSTTITIILIFGPKFYRVLTGKGDTWDIRDRGRSISASFSINGLGPAYDEPRDLAIENEELKEDVQKLASQIEFMKIVRMEINNRHVKPKHFIYLSQQSIPSCNQSPVIRSDHLQLEITDSLDSISPAAELVTEKV